MLLRLVALLSLARFTLSLLNDGMHELSIKKLLQLRNLPLGIKSHQVHIVQGIQST